jgi:lycopene beta-cyclase
VTPLAPSGRPDVDHAIVGAGLSGLLLARALLRSAPPGADRPRILLVDPEVAHKESVTFAYWSRRTTPLDPWVIDRWDALRLVDPAGRAALVGLGDWRYTAVAWGQARSQLLDRLTADRRVSWLQDSVLDIRDTTRGGDPSATLVTSSGEASAAWVYDSRPPSARDLATDFGRARPSPEPSLMQVFRGVWIKTSEVVLDTSAATLLDFSGDGGPDLGFSYVLPTSPTTAMVMAVRMGGEPGFPDPLPVAARLAGTSAWDVTAEESGETVLVGRRPGRRLGPSVLAIGRRGGRVRPSTGYAVMRVLDDTAAIVASLRRHGHPFDIPADPPWQRALDTIWLRALAQERAGLEPAFLSLFAGAGIDSVLRFLDGQARGRDVVAVVRSLPAAPFFRAAARTSGRAVVRVRDGAGGLG